MKLQLVAGGLVDEIAGADGVFAAFRRGRPPSPPSAETVGRGSDHGPAATHSPGRRSLSPGVIGLFDGSRHVMPPDEGGPVAHDVNTHPGTRVELPPLVYSLHDGDAGMADLLGGKAPTSAR